MKAKKTFLTWDQAVKVATEPEYGFRWTSPKSAKDWCWRWKRDEGSPAIRYNAGGLPEEGTFRAALTAWVERKNER